MKLTKRKNGIWMLQYRDEETGKYKRLSTGERDRSKAQVVAQRIFTRTHSTDGDVLTIGDALDNAWERKWKKSKSASKVWQHVETVRRAVGHIPLFEVDYNTIDGYVESMQDSGYKNGTIKARLARLMLALRLASQKGWINSVPETPKVGKSGSKLRYLSYDPDEEGMLLKATEHQPAHIQDVMQDVIVFSLDTGCRLSELINVRKDSVSERGVVFQDRKGGGDHAVPLTSRARESIERLLSDQYWLDRIDGSRRSTKRRTSASGWVTHRFTEIRNAAGLPDVSMHTLRHTCASRLVQAGVELIRVKDWLGHSSITVTERYAHLNPHALQDAVNVLEKGHERGRVVPFRA